jgi:membrane protease YdiL (CAAX protease family)
MIPALVAATGMVLFALFVHQGLPLVLLSGAGMGMTAVAILRSLRDETSIPEALGLSRTGPMALVLMGCLAGLILGGIYRLSSGQALVPGSVQGFLIIAVAIGGTEEILYRGYLQNRFRKAGLVQAVVLAALCHGAYKTALFALPGGDLLFLAFWTVAGGILFGLLKEWAGSVVPPLAAHIAFDAIVYGDRASAPWWIWSG